MTDLAPTPVLALAGVRLLYGSAPLLAPEVVLGDLPEVRLDRRALLFARVVASANAVGATAYALAGLHQSRRS
jgi:hypothetical protein